MGASRRGKGTRRIFRRKRDARSGKGRSRAPRRSDRLFERESGGAVGRDRRFGRAFSRAGEARLDFFAPFRRRVGGVRVSFRSGGSASRRRRQLGRALRFLFIGTNIFSRNVVDFRARRGVSSARSPFPFGRRAANGGGAGGRVAFRPGRLAGVARDSLGNASCLRAWRDENRCAFRRQKAEIGGGFGRRDEERRSRRGAASLAASLFEAAFSRFLERDAVAPFLGVVLVVRAVRFVRANAGKSVRLLLANVAGGRARREGGCSLAGRAD